MTNAAKNAAGTSSLYELNTSHNKQPISASLPASALNAVRKISPAVCTFLPEINSAKRKPADQLIRPPNRADRAPCPPAHQPATSATAAVVYNCHRSTVRRGLLSILKATTRTLEQTREFYKLALAASNRGGALDGRIQRIRRASTASSWSSVR